LVVKGPDLSLGGGVVAETAYSLKLWEMLTVWKDAPANPTPTSTS